MKVMMEIDEERHARFYRKRRLVNDPIIDDMGRGGRDERGVFFLLTLSLTAIKAPTMAMRFLSKRGGGLTVKTQEPSELVPPVSLTAKGNDIIAYPIKDVLSGAYRFEYLKKARRVSAGIAP